MTFQAFCQRYVITADAQLVDEEAHRFKVKLTAPWSTRRHLPRVLTVYVSMGFAHKEPPKAHEVLACLASHSRTIDDAADFEDWARELGYPEDSRKAERTYALCTSQARRLRAFAGDEYAALLACEEE